MLQEEQVSDAPTCRNALQTTAAELTRTRGTHTDTLLHHLINDKVENLLPNVQNATGLAIGGGKLYWTSQSATNSQRAR